MKMRMTCLLVAAGLVLTAHVRVEAQAPPGNVAQVVSTEVKPGASKAYEEGRKRHMAWHKAQKDPWSWHTWQVVSGPDTGSYLTISFGHHWKDLDSWESRFLAGDNADVETHLGPHTARSTVSYFEYLPELSRPAAGNVPSKMSEVVHFMVKPDKVGQFRHAVQRVHEAIQKSSWPAHYYWYTLWNGGRSGHFVLSLPRGSWADMADPDPSMPAMLNKALGPYETAQLMSALGEAAPEQVSELLVYRPDLSYVAAP